MKNKKNSLHQVKVKYLFGSVFLLSTFSQAVVIPTVPANPNPLCYSLPACTQPACTVIETQAQTIAQEILMAYTTAEDSIAQEYKDKILPIKKEILDLAREIDVVTAQLEMLERDNIMTMKKIVKESVRAHDIEATEAFSSELNKLKNKETK